MAPLILASHANFKIPLKANEVVMFLLALNTSRNNKSFLDFTDSKVVLYF